MRKLAKKIETQKYLFCEFNVTFGGLGGNVAKTVWWISDRRSESECDGPFWHIILFLFHNNNIKLKKINRVLPYTNTNTQPKKKCQLPTIHIPLPTTYNELSMLFQFFFIIFYVRWFEFEFECVSSDYMESFSTNIVNPSLNLYEIWFEWIAVFSRAFISIFFLFLLKWNHRWRINIT